MRKTGTGDINTFSKASNAECVTYGPGSSATSHADNETVSIDDYLNSIGVLEAVIKQLGSM